MWSVDEVIPDHVHPEGWGLLQQLLVVRNLVKIGRELEGGREEERREEGGREGRELHVME